MATVIVEGMELPIPDEIAQDDRILIDALKPYYPDIANAEVKRKEGVIRLAKRGGTKGAPHESLVAALESLNPAFELSWKLKQMELEGKLIVEVLIEKQSAIDAAIQQGQADEREINSARKQLESADAIPSRYFVYGF